MEASDFIFQDDDVFVRRIPPNRRNNSGRPTRGAFEGASEETSVYLIRLLQGGVVPNLGPDDELREFPVAWVFDKALTKTALQIEHDSGAHFNIIGKIHIEFKDYLRDNSTRITAEELQRRLE